MLPRSTPEISNAHAPKMSARDTAMPDASANIAGRINPIRLPQTPPSMPKINVSPGTKSPKIRAANAMMKVITAWYLWIDSSSKNSVSDSLVGRTHSGMAKVVAISVAAKANGAAIPRCGLNIAKILPSTAFPNSRYPQTPVMMYKNEHAATAFAVVCVVFLTVARFMV